MAYPQPDADKYSIGGQKFWRLNTPLSSDGDIYESQQGAGGFAIGPDSDIAKVNIAYFDDQVEGFMNQIAISPGRPFAGTMYARNEALYVPSKRPGRFLIWPDDLYDSTWRITGDFNVDPNNRIDFITPVLDVVQYFSPIGLNAGRNDKKYQYNTIPVPDVGGIYVLVVPYYGRRYANFFFSSTVGPLSEVAIYGLNYSQSGDIPFPDNLKALRAHAAVAANAPFNDEILASTDGMYDALVIKITPGNGTFTNVSPIQMRIVTSDQEK